MTARPARYFTLVLAQSSYTAQNPDSARPRLGAKSSGSPRLAEQHRSHPVSHRAKAHGIALENKSSTHCGAVQHRATPSETSNVVRSHIAEARAQLSPAPPVLSTRPW